MSKLSATTALIACLALLAACGGRAWERARAQDTAAAYAEFLREHEGSRWAQEARERSALVRVRSNPTPEGYRDFLAAYPDSPILPELRSVVEEAFFLRARGAGSAKAYDEFLEQFGDGVLAERARGNAAYLEAQGFGGRPEVLAEFAERHPQSDFAAEARRSAAALAVRAESAFRRVGVRIEIAPGTPGADRLERVFAERARSAYQAAGLELVPLGGADDPRAASLPAHLVIRHREEEVRTTLQASHMTSPGILATTRVVLSRAGKGEPIWSEEFTFHSVGATRREGASILFGAGTQPYWSSFFVPVATWNTRVAVRPPQGFSKPVVAVEASGAHAFVLFNDGDFQIFEVGDPERPLLVGEYRRPRDLAHWSGLRIVGDRVVLFGEDGIEVVQLGAKGPQRVAAFERGAVGSITAVENLGGALIAGGKRGLLLLTRGGSEPERLLEREVLGLVRLGERLIVTDGTSLYVSTLPLLRQKRVEGELRLGTGFGPARVRLLGRTAVVLGKRGLVRVDLSRPSMPRVLSRMDMAEVGRIHDATLVRGRLFLLGERGLQLADPRGERVVDAASVAAQARLDASGRHLVMIGEKSLQLVDTTPFVPAGAAAPTPR